MIREKKITFDQLSYYTICLMKYTSKWASLLQFNVKLLQQSALTDRGAANGIMCTSIIIYETKYVRQHCYHGIVNIRRYLC